MADLVAASEESSDRLLEWIEFQTNQLSKSKCSNSGAHLIEAHNDENLHILDPKPTKTKGAPKKLHKKGPLEKNCKKSMAKQRFQQKMQRRFNIITYHLLRRND